MSGGCEAVVGDLERIGAGLARLADEETFLREIGQLMHWEGAQEWAADVQNAAAWLRRTPFSSIDGLCAYLHADEEADYEREVTHGDCPPAAHIFTDVQAVQEWLAGEAP